MATKQLSKARYTALVHEIETKQVQKNFVRRLLRAVNSSASELQSETLARLVDGASISVGDGLYLVGLEQVYSIAYSSYIYRPVYKAMPND